MRHPLLDAGDLKILIGLFLCEFYAHVEREREGEGGGRGGEREREAEAGKLRQRVIKNIVHF